MQDIYWITNHGRLKLAIVARPRGDEWLEADLSRLKDGGIDGIVSLLTAPEEEMLGLRDEANLAEALGLRFLSYPIPDRHVPGDDVAFSRFIAEVAEQLRGGSAIGIHCRGSIGRSTVTAASLLLRVGWDPSRALEEIELARGCPVPDTPEQRAWILGLRSPHFTR